MIFLGRHDWRDTRDLLASSVQHHSERMTGERIDFHAALRLARGWMRENGYGELTAAEASRAAQSIVCNWLPRPDDTAVSS